MFVKHLDVKGWDMDVELYPGNSSEPPGGCVLRNVRHAGYNLLRDLRVCRVWLATSPPHREDPSSTKGVKSYLLGSPSMPVIGGPTVKEGSEKDSFQKLIAPHLDAGRITTAFTLDDPANPGFGDPDFGRIDFTQTYILTNYTDNPAHEPGHVLTAARLYPLFRFQVPSKDEKKKPVGYVRVDYRMEFVIDQGLWKEANEKRLKAGGPFDHAGIFLDFDRVTALPVLRIRDLFDAAEKPVQFEVIGKGLRFGQKGDWDNIHLWGMAETGMERFPSTPGAFHALHTHWRWSADLVDPSTTQRLALGLKGGQQFGPIGKGMPIVDPKIFNQNLSFAITAVALPGTDGPSSSMPPEWKASANGSTMFFEELFENARMQPFALDKGARLVVWFCLEAFRSAYQDKWNGTFFVHGMYFAHDRDKTGILGEVLGGVKEGLLKPQPKREWQRPKTPFHPAPLPDPSSTND